MGRFLQTDPIGYGSGPNIYAYVRGDPVNRIDLLGLLDAGYRPYVNPVDALPNSGEIIVTGDLLAAAFAAENAAAAAAFAINGAGYGPLTGAVGNESTGGNATGPKTVQKPPSKPPKVTPKQIADAQKRMIEACAADQTSQACTDLKALYLALSRLYSQQNPLPEASGPEHEIDPLTEGVNRGLEAVFCAIDIATLGRASGAIQVIVQVSGAAYGCSSIFGFTY